jgi:HD-like signal output (HDOD) protein/ActR/RegA family two-component response regulator
LKKVLFVDDEPNILQGLQRMLRPLRQEWDMQFAQSGEEALRILDDDEYDVVITDMRMPVMNGAQLLEKVSQRRPNIVRIILSGQADQIEVLKSVGSSHQYLAKPCDAETLKATLARAGWLRNLLESRHLQFLTTSMKSLPSVPVLYFEIVKMLDDPNTSLRDIADRMSQDPGMTAKILQIVNSAYFGSAKNISSLLQAVSMIGLDSIKALTLSTHVFSHFEKKLLPGFSMISLWKHSMFCARLAEKIAREKRLSPILTDHTFTAALLHDVGILILATNLPDEYAPVLFNQLFPDITLAEAEEELMGASHSEVGAYLMGLWGLPDPIIQAIAYHHRPHDQLDRTVSPLAITHIANALVSETTPRDHYRPVQNLDTVFIDETNMSESLNAWRQYRDQIIREEN